MVSILSAITSLDCSEKLIPSVPIDMPSLTPMVLNRNPVSPASVTPIISRIVDSVTKKETEFQWNGSIIAVLWPCFTSPERSIRCMLQGFPSNHTEQMPTCGRAIVSGVNPVAYNIAWEAPWLGGSVMMREYLFKMSFSASACMNILLRPADDCLVRLKDSALLKQAIPTNRQKKDDLMMNLPCW